MKEKAYIAKAEKNQVPMDLLVSLSIILLSLVLLISTRSGILS